MKEQGRYRKLFVRLWRHADFRGLSHDQKLVALYALTGPQSNRCGVCPWSVETAADDLGMPAKTLARHLTAVCARLEWDLSRTPRVLEIPTWFRWNPPANGKVARSIYHELSEIPPCPARERALARLTVILKGFRDPGSIPFQNPVSKSGSGSGSGSGSETGSEGRARSRTVISN